MNFDVFTNIYFAAAFAAGFSDVDLANQIRVPVELMAPWRAGTLSSQARDLIITSVRHHLVSIEQTSA